MVTLNLSKSVTEEAIQSTRKAGNCWAGRPGLRDHRPSFSQVIPHFCDPHFNDVLFIQICQFCALHWAKNRIFSVYQKCSVTQNMPKMRFRQGLHPGSRWESSRDAPPDPLVGWGVDTLPDLTPLSAFGASIATPSALAICAPPRPSLATDLVHR